MAQGYSNEYNAAVVAGGKVNGSMVNAGLRTFRCILALDSAIFKGANGDTDIICRLPPGVSVKQIDVVSTVSLTTSTLSFGIASDPTKFGAAKAYGTTANAMVTWTAAAQMDDAVPTTPTDVLMTVGTANLPTTAGAFIVVDIIVSARG